MTAKAWQKLCRIYMSIPYNAAFRPVFIFRGVLYEDFPDEVLDFEFGAGKKVGNVLEGAGEKRR